MTPHTSGTGLAGSHLHLTRKLPPPRLALIIAEAAVQADKQENPKESNPALTLFNPQPWPVWQGVLKGTIMASVACQQSVTL